MAYFRNHLKITGNLYFMMCRLKINLGRKSIRI